jgi:hypothetical protein
VNLKWCGIYEEVTHSTQECQLNGKNKENFHTVYHMQATDQNMEQGNNGEGYQGRGNGYQGQRGGYQGRGDYRGGYQGRGGYKVDTMLIMVEEDVVVEAEHISIFV